MGSLDKMFDPRVVALIGASEREGSVGQALMKNLLLGKGKREIYPVNTSKETVMGLKCYPSIKNVPEHVDLVVIATPALTVPKLVEECGEADVDGVVIISAGFRETGEEGRKLEEEIRTVKEKYGMRILGPNCFGFIRPNLNLNSTFLLKNPEPGQIAFISQSGALGSAILDWAISSHIGFSMFVSVGTTLDIDFGDLIDFLGEDPHTRSILIYMESVGNARKFMSAARGFARTKPTLVIKPGKYSAGAKAALSHTGSMAGSYEAYEAAFKRAGVVRVDEIMDLFNCATVLDSRYLPAGPGLAVITNAGGPGVIAADSIVENEGELAKLSEQTLNELNSFLPHYWSHGNPIDVLGDADMERYTYALRTCLNDTNVDGVTVIYTPQGGTKPEELANAVAKIAKGKTKPLLTVWMGGQEIQEARGIFHCNDVPTYDTPEEAVKTYMYMYKYKRNLDLLYETPEELPIDLSPPKNHLKVMIRKALKENRLVLTQDETDKFLDAYGIPRAKGELAKNIEEAIAISSSIGYPVVLKIISPEIIHKVDVGGVIVEINSEEDLRNAFATLMDRIKKEAPNAMIKGAYVQKMIKPIDYEVILGSKKDNDFGSVIVFGAGGVSVELFKDFSIGLPPLNRALVRRIMEETKIYDVLKNGLRGKPPADLREIEEIMAKFSNMIVDFPEIKELDINPLAISDRKAYGVDSRVVLDPEAVKIRDPYSHLVIMPYPTKYVMPWRLKDGTQVLLRPIKPEDEPLEAELIQGLSEETSRFRFFQVIRNITHEMLVRFCNIDYDREMAIIAEYSEGGRRRNVGVGRIIMEPNRKRGEFAVVVADDFQGKGLGTKLVDMLIEIADEKGLESIYGIVLPENRAMINLCKKLGFDIRHGTEEVIVELHHLKHARTG